MYEQEQQKTFPQPLPSMAGSNNLPDADAENAGVVEQAQADTATERTEPDDHPHGECCDECKRTCKRNFWTSVLNAIIKIATIVLAGFGVQSFSDAD